MKENEKKHTMGCKEYGKEHLRVLVISDICCVGGCSETVALPILSAFGIEACPLPTSLLSTHSVGFEGYTRLSLADEGERIVEHLKSTDIRFDAIYIAYLGGEKEAMLAKSALCLLKEDGKLIVDPAMADFGALYPDLTPAFISSVQKLCSAADILIPNLTEAQLLAGIEDISSTYEDIDENYIRKLICALQRKFKADIIVTGIELEEKIAIALSSGELITHGRIDRVCHGAGDVFASALVGALLKDKSLHDAASLAAEFTLNSIKNTLSDPAHWYGLHFEQMLKDLINKIAD